MLIEIEFLDHKTYEPKRAALTDLVSGIEVFQESMNQAVLLPRKLWVENELVWEYRDGEGLQLFYHFLYVNMILNLSYEVLGDLGKRVQMLEVETYGQADAELTKFISEIRTLVATPNKTIN